MACPENKLKMKPNNSLRVFVVDDDNFCLAMYEQHLRNLGITDVQSFNDGITCLHNLALQPDVIFLDHGMDILNGEEVLKEIKRVNPDIYVVFISGQEDVEIAINSLKYGAFDYIVKGINEEKRLEQILEKIIEVRELLKKRHNDFTKTIPSIL